MNPSPKPAAFEPQNPPFFDGSLDERFAEARSKSRRAVGRILRRRRHDVEDVLQNACIKAFLQLSTFRKEANFNTWFYRIAINEALMHLRWHRSAGREGESLTDMSSAHSLFSDTPSPEEIACKEEARRFLRRAINRLPRCQREEALTVLNEDTQRQRRQTNGEKSRYFHAKNQLRRMLEPLFQVKETVKCG